MQRLAVVTDPAGARCAVTQAGQVLGVVEATPGAIELPRGTEVLELICHREGYLDERELVEVVNTAYRERYEASLRERQQRLAAAERAPGEPVSEVGRAAGTALGAAVGVALLAVLLPFEPLFKLGAAAAGGGDAIDRTTAAVYQYSAPDLLLTPQTFRAETDRDAHFARRTARAEAIADRTRLILDPRLYCDAGDSASACASPRMSVDAALAWRLAQLERQRALTRIDPTSATTP